MVALLFGSFAHAQTKLLRFPDIRGDRVVFTYGGDLWTAPAAGGSATHLTSHPGVELFGKFSPDGKWIAFTGQYDGTNRSLSYRLLVANLGIDVLPGTRTSASALVLGQSGNGLDQRRQAHHLPLDPRFVVFIYRSSLFSFVRRWSGRAVADANGRIW
jgi:hypothetical protein